MNGCCAMLGVRTQTRGTIMPSNQIIRNLVSLVTRRIDDGSRTRRYHSFRNQYGNGVKCILPRGRCSYVIQRSANGWAYCHNLQSVGLAQVKERDVSLLYAVRSIDGIFANI